MCIPENVTYFHDISNHLLASGFQYGIYIMNVPQTLTEVEGGVGPLRAPQNFKLPTPYP